MTPARVPKSFNDEEKLLLINDESGLKDSRHIDDIANILQVGDLLVVNDAATLPASLYGKTEMGDEVELRLVRIESDGSRLAILFGKGDWRTPTEDRDPPPKLKVGARIRLSEDLTAQIDTILASRLMRIRFNLEGSALLGEIYRVGKPIQYSYLTAEQGLWDFQNVYASRPWAIEMPSAGRPLRWKTIFELRRRGVEIAYLTHAAGISSTGSDELDALLPMREHFDLPQATIDAIQRTKAKGRRVIAVGTSVVRALEGCALAHQGELVAGEGETDLMIGPGFKPNVVDGLLSGMHEPSESHYRLFGAFASRRHLEEGLRQAAAENYQSHEFGDSCLILSKVVRSRSGLAVQRGIALI